MNSEERKELRKKAERVRNGKYRSRAHSKAEKRKQRKAWKKRKAKEGIESKEKAVIADVQEIPEAEPPAKKKCKEHTLNRPSSRGTYLVSLSKLKYQYKNPTEERKKPAEKMQQKLVDSAGAVGESASAGGNQTANRHVEKNVPASKIQGKRKDVGGTSASSKRIDRAVHNEIDRSLLKVDKTTKIGSGTFGNCYLAVYRNDFTVVVKEITSGMTNSPQQAREEVLREAAAITGIGDHWGIPHLFGVCTRQAPYCLVLQYHALHSQSVTLFKAASGGVLKDAVKCADILKQTCKVLMHIHARGYLHNDLKANNVVIDGAKNNPVIIDFGKSCQIVKAKLRKPRLDIDKAMRKYPHIAPEIHRGAKQSTSSDVFSFGVLIVRLFKEAKSEIPQVLKEIAQRCQSSNPRKRPSLAELFETLSKLS